MCHAAAVLIQGRHKLNRLRHWVQTVTDLKNRRVSENVTRTAAEFTSCLGFVELSPVHLFEVDIPGIPAKSSNEQVFKRARSEVV